MNQNDFLIAKALVISELKSIGGAGYVEAKTLTYDGNGEGKESYKPATYTYVRAGGIIDPASVTEIAMLHQGNNLVLSASDLTIETPNEHIVSISYMGVPGVYVIDEKNEVGVSAGTYVLSELRYASCVTKIVAETLHPIDPKFLPETRIVIDLPVDIKTLFSEIDLPLNGDMAASIDRAAENLLPVYLRITEYWSSGIERRYNFRLECEETHCVGLEDNIVPDAHIFTGMFSEGMAVIRYNPNNATINGSVVRFATE